MEPLTWLCCDYFLRLWVCEYVCFLNRWESKRLTALIVLHGRLMRSTSPWAAICLSFSTRTDSGQRSGGETSTGCGPASWKMGSWQLGSCFVTFLICCSFWSSLGLFFSEWNQINKIHSSGPHECWMTAAFSDFALSFFKYRLWLIFRNDDICRVKANQLSSYIAHQTHHWNPLHCWLKNQGSCSAF